MHQAPHTKLSKYTKRLKAQTETLQHITPRLQETCVCVGLIPDATKHYAMISS